MRKLNFKSKMMNLKITLFAAMLATAGISNAQETSEKYETKAEMQEQMSLIVNGLNLEPAQIQELGQMMEAKRQQKEKLMLEIDEKKAQLNTLELNIQKQIQGMLTADEWAKYQKEIKPQLDENLEERMERIED